MARLVNPIPAGRVPVRVTFVLAPAVVVTEKMNAFPTVAVAAAALVNAGTVPAAGAFTVRVKACVADPPTFVATNDTLYTPAARLDAPLNAAVPDAPGVRDSPAGSAALVLIVGDG